MSEKNPESVMDILDCETYEEAKNLIRNTHPAIIGQLFQLIRDEVPKGFNSQQLAHPDLRNPLKRLVEKGNEQLKDFRKRIPDYLSGDPFLDEAREG